jgi:hypothetical protein
MMLGHEVFDPEVNRRVLVDHAFIVAGGEITKQAKNWLGERLDATKRSHMMFMDRDDILNLFIVTNLRLPKGALPKVANSDDFDDDITVLTSLARLPEGHASVHQRSGISSKRSFSPRNDLNPRSKVVNS